MSSVRLRDLARAADRVETTFGLQQFAPGASGAEKQEGTDFFFDVALWLLFLVPIALVILLAALKRKRTPELPHVGIGTWDEKVVRNPLPVVVHVCGTWSIGDRVIENQVVKLAEETRGELEVLWLDVDQNRGLLEHYPTLEKRSVALFREGRLLWQGQGVHGHEELLQEIRETLGGACSPPGRR